MLQRSPPDRIGGGRAGFGAETALGDRLKRFFDAVASEPVPDRLLQLAAALDAKIAEAPIDSPRSHRRRI